MPGGRDRPAVARPFAPRGGDVVPTFCGSDVSVAEHALRRPPARSPTSTPTIMLFSAHRLTKSYSAGTARCSATARVLSGLDLEIDAGQVVGVVGGRASGKTTLVRCVAELARPDRGALHWAPSARRPRIVSAAPAAFPFETVRDVLARAAGEPLVDPDRLGETVTHLALDDVIDRAQAALTTDERARLALAVGLATRHPLLLLDGTADLLGAFARPAVHDALRRHAADGGAALLTGRDRDAVAALAAPVWQLSRGRLTTEPVEICEPQAARVAEARLVTRAR